MKLSNQSGFTLIEILMVVLLVGILSAVAIPQFISFQTEAKNAATSGNLGALRSAIAIQYAQMLTRCGTAPGVYPDVTSINANDIADGNSTCTTPAQVPATDTGFISGGIPANPWGEVATVTLCVNCDPLDDDPGTITTACDGVDFTGGWCYDSTNGRIWADSVLNGAAAVGSYEGSL